MKLLLILTMLLILVGCKKDNLSDSNNVSNTDGFVIDFNKAKPKLKTPVFKFGGSTNLIGDSAIFLDAENLPTGNYVRTIKLRVKPETLTGTLIFYGKKGNKEQCAIAFTPTSNLFFWGYYADVYSNLMLPSNKWSDIALTYDGITVNLYVDDKKICSENLELNTAEADKIILGEKFKGEISNIEIFDIIEKKYKPESNWEIKE